MIQRLKARNTDIGSADLSVFLEGLIVAAGLGVRDSNSSEGVKTSGSTVKTEDTFKC